MRKPAAQASVTRKPSAVLKKPAASGKMGFTVEGYGVMFYKNSLSYGVRPKGGKTLVTLPCFGSPPEKVGELIRTVAVPMLQAGKEPRAVRQHVEELLRP